MNKETVDYATLFPNLITGIMKAVAAAEDKCADGFLAEDDGEVYMLPSALSKDMAIGIYGADRNGNPSYAVCLVLITAYDEDGAPEGKILWEINTPDAHKNSLKAAISAVLHLIEISSPRDAARWAKAT